MSHLWAHERRQRRFTSSFLFSFQQCGPRRILPMQGSNRLCRRAPRRSQARAVRQRSLRLSQQYPRAFAAARSATTRAGRRVVQPHRRSRIGITRPSFFGGELRTTRSQPERARAPAGILAPSTHGLPCPTAHLRGRSGRATGTTRRRSFRSGERALASARESHTCVILGLQNHTRM